MLKYFLNEFKTYIPLQLPQLMDLNRMGTPNIYDDYILLEFSLANDVKSSCSRSRRAAAFIASMSRSAV